MAAAWLGRRKGAPAEMKQPPDSLPASPQDCRQALHRLAGAAGSYGFAALGQAARQAEHSCTGSASGLPDPAALAELQRCLVQAGLPADDTTR